MSTVLRKKLGAQRVGRSPVAALDEVSTDFAAKLEDRLRRLLHTMCGALVLECEVRKLQRVLEDIPVPAMLGVVSVDGVEDHALVNVSSDLVYHIVDLRMGGDPAQAPPPTARSFTAIDSALCEAFVRQVIDCFTIAMRRAFGVPIPDLMQLERTEQNITQVRIAPGNADVLVLSVNLDIGEAARSGNFDLIMPLSVLDLFRAAAAKTPKPEREGAARDFWRHHIKDALSAARIDVNGILYRTELPASEIEALRPGDVVALPAASVNAVSIRIGRDRDDLTFGAARLGQIDGRKVLKLSDDPDPDIVGHIRKGLSD
ncbi:MAG: FliM/FliN family flagellar motor switch protein [Rubricella sp.]